VQRRLALADEDAVKQRKPIIAEGKKKLFDAALEHAKKDPKHEGHDEPLILIFERLGDTLTWKVLDEDGNLLPSEVEVHPFSDMNAVPTNLRPATAPPPLFNPPFSTDPGGIHSGPPTQAAASHPFGWHKFTVKTEGSDPLDPCIFVGD